jgi:hypothetical protein
VTEADLEEAVEDGIIPSRKLNRWRPAASEEFPTPNTGEIVVFLPFFYFGLGLPAGYWDSFIFMASTSTTSTPIQSSKLLSSSIYARHIA